MFTDRDGCDISNLVEFDQLPYANKVVFVHKNYPDIQSAAYIPGFEKDDSVGFCMDYPNFFTDKKYYDAFDFVNWINQRKRDDNL